MKTVAAKQTFKKVSEKQVSLFPALADRLGKQRPACDYVVPEYEMADLEMLTANHGATLLTCLNDAMVMLSKSQFLIDPANWAFKPSAESLTMEALAASFESVSRGRMLTLENAGKLAAWIQKNIAAIVTGVQISDPSFQATQASAIVGVVAKYTAYESKGAEFGEKVVNRLNQILEAVIENEELAVEFASDAVLAGIAEALIKKFSKAAEEEITVDAL